MGWVLDRFEVQILLTNNAKDIDQIQIPLDSQDRLSHIVKLCQIYAFMPVSKEVYLNLSVFHMFRSLTKVWFSL